jgi:hypothetical protein
MEDFSAHPPDFVGARFRNDMQRVVVARYPEVASTGVARAARASAR